RTDHLVKDAEIGTAVGVKVAFDNEASNNGYYAPVRNELIYSSVYYPYVIEFYLSKFERSLSLYGKKSFMPYRMTIDAGINGKIVFSPTVDEKKIVTWQGVKKKTVGEKSKIIYPDGSVTFGKADPDYERLKNMK
ncbi:hypothetical protein SGP15_24930, partial [Brenneria sp. L4-2C]|uniref:hypothetical protein n=2 Tax=unclassified Brenneria TaxID=2634434 RepID=UPI0029C1658D